MQHSNIRAGDAYDMLADVNDLTTTIQGGRKMICKRSFCAFNPNLSNKSHGTVVDMLL